MSRGYFGIGVFHGKSRDNIGTLWRSAHTYDAAFIFTVGRRYKTQSTDVWKTSRHVPLFHYQDWFDFRKHRPKDCPLVCVEICEKAKALEHFTHPERAVYLLGAEDNGLPEEIMDGSVVVKVASKNCLNVAVAGSIVMYDRWVKGGRSV